MKWRVLLTVGIGTFMWAVNGSVVNAVLPLMRRGLQVDFATIEWVVTIYLLVVSGLLLLFGRLGDLWGHRTWFVSGLAGFAAASGLCCLAPDATFLIVFRVLQAIAAAMLFANSPAILTKSFPPEQRGQALGLQATMTYLGLTVGPSLGGLLAARWGWRAVFAISVPIGAVAFYMALRFVKREAIEVRGLGPARAGLLLTAQPLVMTVAAPLSGIASDRIGTRAPTTLGMALLAAGLLWLSHVDPRTPLIEAELALALCGLGTGIFIGPNNSGLMGAAPLARQGIAAGVLGRQRASRIGGGGVSRQMEGLAAAPAEVDRSPLAAAARLRHPRLAAEGHHAGRGRPQLFDGALANVPEGKPGQRVREQ